MACSGPIVFPKAADETRTVSTDPLPDTRRVSLLLLVRSTIHHLPWLGRNSYCGIMSNSLVHCFHPIVQDWFTHSFKSATRAQEEAWPAISRGENTLLLAPTGSGKTLAAFLAAIDRIMFGEENPDSTVRVLYISPLKALGVDVERNLRSPISGILEIAKNYEANYVVPQVAVRSGDTPASERYRLNRKPPDILITTPESLYLMLTAKSSRAILGRVETVIVDEIHSLVGNKRGVHLFLSLERLEALRRRTDAGQPALQRIGLSATQRPLDEIARLLGGANCVTRSPANQKDKAIESTDETDIVARPVTIIRAERIRPISLTIEVPVDDMTSLTEPSKSSDAAETVNSIPTIWPAIHERLVRLIKKHRSTMIFVNSRRLAERLADSVNEVANEKISLAHHGSLAKDQRLEIEDRLKCGELPAIVATSSLELGIDMGAVDLVIQVEAPPTIASGIQRIGRAGHQVGGRSKGVVFPKFRGDLLACGAAAKRMLAGEVEETYYPRNPLDVLAQQIVAMVALEPMAVEEIYAICRGAASFHDLPRSSFDGVMDLLAGRYPSHEFSELRPRINWDRVTGVVSPRKGTQRLAILNGGTIPDRGLYGVFLAHGDGRSKRVGELDEEMVFEIHPGEVFLLGASSWRVLDITNDRVLVSSAPGEPGRMPFWRGDSPGRPVDFGEAIGKLARELTELPAEQASQQLEEEHSMTNPAATNLVAYLHDQRTATGVVPGDKTIVVESFIDEVGDWRVCILSPFGSRIHAPWAMVIAAQLSDSETGNVDFMWADDGIVFRLPESEKPPAVEKFFPESGQVERQVIDALGTTAMFAAKFRENAARALLLPRRQPGQRTPLWLQRRRAADLLSVASRYASFPMMMETYRECLRDVFDLPGLQALLESIESKRVKVKAVSTQHASPFAAALLFNYVGNYIYDGDVPLAEKRAASLSLNYTQLKELLGEAELRDLLDVSVIHELALEVQRLDSKYPIRDRDGICDLLLLLGDLERSEILERSHQDAALVNQWIDSLVVDHRIVPIRIAGTVRFITIEDAGCYRDALGVPLPEGIPEVFLSPAQNAIQELTMRYAKTHTPFVADDLAKRWGITASVVDDSLASLLQENRLIEGAFLPQGSQREWCDPKILRTLKGRSLSRLRAQIKPVDQSKYVDFLMRWQQINAPRSGPDALLDVFEQIQGVAIPFSDLEQFVLPSRIRDFRPADLDELVSAGEIIWRGSGGLNSGDGRVAVYLTDNFAQLALPIEMCEGELAERIREILMRRGASFFDTIATEIGGFRNDTLETLWQMVWAGEITNDTLTPLRSRLQTKATQKKMAKGRRSGRYRSRRVAQHPGSEGRWSLLDFGESQSIADTERQFVIASQLLERDGIVVREGVLAENLEGGFSRFYPVFKAMEESGRIRRGYFVDGLGPAQFALPGADERLRVASEKESEAIILAATDPANAFGQSVKWPERSNSAGPRPARTSGARVIIFDGQLIGYLNRASDGLLTFLSKSEPSQTEMSRKLAKAITGLAKAGPVFITKIDGKPAKDSSFSRFLEDCGFQSDSRGRLLRRTV